MKSILGTTRKADITFHANGRIDISSRVAELLDLRRGDVIDICIDSGEYYLFVKHRFPTVGRHEAAIYPTNCHGRNFRTWSCRLCSAMLYVCRPVVGHARLPVGVPVKHDLYGTLLPIITKCLL